MFATAPEGTLSQTGALTHGLEILRLLAEADGPLSSTEIARRVDLHQSSASRILKTLIAVGYVRKPDYRSFAVDLGVLTLGGSALRHFGLATKPRAALAALAERCDGLLVSLATLWRGQIIYFLRYHKGHEPVLLSVGGYPLHLSSPALRLLLALPEEHALQALEGSRQRYGWERPTRRVPADPGAALKAAVSLLRHDALVLDGWQGEGRLSAAIPIEVPGEPPAALALAGPAGERSVEEILLLLQEGRRAVETELHHS